MNDPYLYCSNWQFPTITEDEKKQLANKDNLFYKTEILDKCEPSSGKNECFYAVSVFVYS